MGNLVNTKGSRVPFPAGNSMVDVTPSGADVDVNPKATLFVLGTAGDLTIDTPNGETITIPSAGITILQNLGGHVPVRAKKVYNTGTAATSIWAIV